MAQSGRRDQPQGSRHNRDRQNPQVQQMQDPVLLYPELGACNNHGFISHFIAESPLTATLKFVPLNHWPICEPYNHNCLLALANVYAEARYHASMITNIPLKKAIAIGETLAPKIPNTKYDTMLNARTSFTAWMKIGFIDDIFSTLGEYDLPSYQAFIQRDDVRHYWDEADIMIRYPPTPADIEDLTFKNSLLYAYYFASYIRQPLRTLTVEAITMAYCSLSKRGQVTDDFCTKIVNSIRDELGVNISLNASTMHALYRGYLTGVDHENASDVFAALIALIPDVGLRLRLTLNQAAGSGLTVYTIIGRAVRKFRDFPWGYADTLTSGEFAAWVNAMRIVGDNVYYGFKKDLEAVRSTQYKSIGYIARDLLIKLNGEVTLRRYAGLGGNIKNKLALDRLIEHYIGQRTGDARAQTEVEANMIPSVDALAAINMFT